MYLEPNNTYETNDYRSTKFSRRIPARLRRVQDSGANRKTAESANRSFGMNFTFNVSAFDPFWDFAPPTVAITIDIHQ